MIKCNRKLSEEWHEEEEIVYIVAVYKQNLCYTESGSFEKNVEC